MTTLILYLLNYIIIPITLALAVAIGALSVAVARLDRRVNERDGN